LRRNMTCPLRQLAVIVAGRRAWERLGSRRLTRLII
jgi:hypothetical protein